MWKSIKRWLLLVLSGCASFNALSQQPLYAAFYNVENLFDTIDDPHRNDNDYLPTSGKQWDTRKYRNKLANLSDIIAAMNSRQAPDILGLCEVENNAVLRDLIRQDKLIAARYGILHFDSPDERGIDNALLYKQGRIKPVKTLKYEIVYANKRTGTRDILLSQLRVDNQSDIVILVIHAPSRLGGERSEVKRIRVASVIRHITDSIRRASPDMPVLIMGDFNDEPCDKSIDSVLNARCDGKGTFINPLAEWSRSGKGSISYKGKWMLFDQILCTNAIHSISKESRDPSTPLSSRWKIYTAGIFDDPRLLKKERKGNTIPFRTYAGKTYQNGYSDHLPVYIKVVSW